MTRKSSLDGRKSSSFDPVGHRARSVLALRSSYPPLQVVFRAEGRPCSLWTECRLRLTSRVASRLCLTRD